MSENDQYRLVPGSPEWEHRRHEMLAQEAGNPPFWWWLSFVNAESGYWLGGAFIKAPGFMSAIEKAHALNISPPAAQVRGFELRADFPGPPSRLVDKLLSEDDLETDPNLGGALRIDGNIF